MKKFLILLFLLLSLNSFAQLNQYPGLDKGIMNGGLGLNWIDGELFYTFHFRPELSFANFGVGLDLALDINSKGDIRKENFNEFSDYISVIRYVRYGMKNDPVFIKLGALDYYTLGHGSIIYQYNNSPSFDTRKSGLVADIDFGQFGVESIYSSFGEAGLVGLRGYVKPLQFTQFASVPVIGNLEVGATFSTDLNKYSGVISGAYDTTTQKFKAVKDNGAISIIGFDLGLPIVRNSMVGVTIYLDYAKILNFGSGVSTGIMFNFNGLGLVTAEAKLERRFNQDRYIPAYFNSIYELERFNVTNLSAGAFTSKAHTLSLMTKSDNGYYGELGISVMNLLNIVGSYQRLDKTPESGILHLVSEIAPESAPVLVRAGYDKAYIKNEKDLFKLDDRSIAYFEAGYKPTDFMLVSILTSWTFSPLRDGDKNIIGFEPQKRIEPRVSFMVPLNFGGNR